jgi:hypothetical protein
MLRANQPEKCQVPQTQQSNNVKGPRCCPVEPRVQEHRVKKRERIEPKIVALGNESRTHHLPTSKGGVACGKRANIHRAAAVPIDVAPLGRRRIVSPRVPARTHATRQTVTARHGTDTYRNAASTRDTRGTSTARGYQKQAQDTRHKTQDISHKPQELP